MASQHLYKPPVSYPRFFVLSPRQQHENYLRIKLYTVKHIINNPRGNPIETLNKEIESLNLSDLETTVLFEGRLKSTFAHLDTICQDLRVCDFLIDLHWHYYMLDTGNTLQR